jgi:hypothetical protein
VLVRLVTRHFGDQQFEVVSHALLLETLHVPQSHWPRILIIDEYINVSHIVLKAPTEEGLSALVRTERSVSVPFPAQ